MPKVLARVGFSVAALTFILIALLVWAQPALAAFACPRCFGFERLQDSIYVDPAMTQAERIRLGEVISEGQARAAHYLGALHEHPVILACASPECSKRIGDKGARAVAYAQFGLKLAPRGLDSVTVAHELTHIEVHERLGMVRFLSGALPAWFDEGLAVVASDDPHYLLPEGSANRCRMEPSTDLPSSRKDWMRRAGADSRLYAQASCRLLRWSDAHGGRQALLAVIDRVSSGEPFERVWSEGNK